MRATSGFVFSLDALLAVVLLGFFVMSFVFFSSKSVEDPYPILVLTKQADDALIVLDKSGTLDTLDGVLISQQLDNMLEPQLSWNMELDYYNYSTQFDHVANLSFGADYSRAEKLAVAERNIVIFRNTSSTQKEVEYYGTARLRVWTR